MQKQLFPTDTPAKKPKDEGWQMWIDAWFDFYKGRNQGVRPMFNPIQGKALKSIRKHLQDVAAEKYPDKPKDLAGLDSWKFILCNWNRLDPWLQGQYDLTVVLKKINDIINQLKNGANKKSASNGTNAIDALIGALAEKIATSGRK